MDTEHKTGIDFYTTTHTPIHMECKGCGSTNTVKHSIYNNRKGKYQRYKCKDCGRVFVDGKLGEKESG